MARSRQLKPDFFKDEDLSACSHAARLLFQGLWTLADRAGRLEDRPLKLKAELFPYEAADVEGLLAELARPKAHGTGAMILRYLSGGRKYIQISNFERHQKCHPKEPPSTLPGPVAANNEDTRPAVERNGSTVSSQPESVPSVPSESKIAVPSWVPSSPRPAAADNGAGSGQCGSCDFGVVGAPCSCPDSQRFDPAPAGPPPTGRKFTAADPPPPMSPEDRQAYAEAILEAWGRQRGAPLLMGSNTDGGLISWLLGNGSRPPVRLGIVLGAIERIDRKLLKRNTPLSYADKPIRAAAVQWARGTM